MSAPGWIQVKGGHHYCGLGKHFFDASPADPGWLHYVNSTTATACACGACATAALQQKRRRRVS